MVELVSAGGVVLRIGKSRGEVVLCGRGQPRIWALPKGTPDPGETRVETALREVREEVGITEISLLDDFNIEERYSAELDGISYTKEVKYFIGICDNKSVITQEEEIQNYKWIKFEEASNYFSYESTMNTLYEANNFLKKTPRC